jgi:hypothetical protein
LVLAAGAQAEQRYAAPAGSGSECTQANPCSLSEAVAAAKAGDEVIVTPGSYTLLGPISFPLAPNVQVHGEAGAAMPRVAGSVAGPAFFMTQAGDSLGYMEVENDANGGVGVYCVSAKIERVKAKVVGSGAIGAFAFTGCSIRNSLFRVEGTGAAGLRSAPGGNSGNLSASVRNVTAIATGSASIGAISEDPEFVTGSFTLELLNSIVQGAETDLKATSGPKGPGIIAASHSNFDKATPVEEGKVLDGGGNQSAAPLFVDAENGDYREASGSPTIDAGLAGELGPLDLGGNARVMGAAPDIGAFESTPQPVAGQIESLSLSPTRFRAASSGEAVASKRKKKKPAPKSTKVSYLLSEKATVAFSVERGLPGRKVGKTCKKATRGNRKHKPCTLYKPLGGGFTVSGNKGANGFTFTGRVGGKALKPGRYRLRGGANGSSRQVAFTIAP